MAIHRRYRWVWFFVILAVLGLAAVVIQIRFNLAQQLKPEQLQAAHQLWQQNGPKNYRLQFTQISSGGKDIFVAWVRNGEVRAVVRKQDPSQPDTAGQRLQPEQYSFYGMDGLFGIIDDFLRLEVRTYMRATFDPQDGHVTHFVRRVSGTQERQEITDVKLEPAAPGEPIP